jgi:hypothetical protein
MAEAAGLKEVAGGSLSKGPTIPPEQSEMKGNFKEGREGTVAKR